MASCAGMAVSSVGMQELGLQWFGLWHPLSASLCSSHRTGLEGLGGLGAYWPVETVQPSHPHPILTGFSANPERLAPARCF
ncbi:hypothetical protein MHYP_G00285810 [Metynnis hypsauchen]